MNYSYYTAANIKGINCRRKLIRSVWMDLKCLSCYLPSAYLWVSCSTDRSERCKYFLQGVTPAPDSPKPDGNTGHSGHSSFSPPLPYSFHVYKRTNKNAVSEWDKVIPRLNCKCLTFYQQEGGGPKTEIHSCCMYYHQSFTFYSPLSALSLPMDERQGECRGGT